MTINEAHLLALRATITLTYIPVITPGLYDTFAAHPDTYFLAILDGFLGCFWWKYGHFSTGNVSGCLGNMSVGPGNLFGGSGNGYLDT